MSTMSDKGLASGTTHVSAVAVTGTVVAASRSGGVGNDCARGSADQSTGDRGTCSAASDSANQGARAAAKQRTAKHAIVTCGLTSGKRQRHRCEQNQPAHPVPPSFAVKKFLRCKSILRRRTKSACASGDIALSIQFR
jgi:hypothetical protein